MIKSTQSPIQKVAFGLIIFVIVIFGLKILQDIIVPFIIAGLFSFLLYPICSYLEKQKIPRALAILITIIISIGFLSLFVYLAYSQIIQLESLIPIIEKKSVIWFNETEKFLKTTLRMNHTQLVAEGRKHLTDILKNSTLIISQTLSTTSSFLMNISLLPLYIFLFLLYRDFLKTFIYKLLNNTSKHQIALTLNKINSVVRSYIVGLLLVILIIGTLNSTALLVLGIQNALFFGFFAAALVLLPYIGIAIGSALPILIALITKDSYWYAVGVAGSFGVIQFLEGNFITPMIVGNKVSINSMAAIIALLLFANLWGLSGLVLALPLTAILKVIFDSSPNLKAWGFLLGDADHQDVKDDKKKYKFKSLIN